MTQIRFNGYNLRPLRPPRNLIFHNLSFILKRRYRAVKREVRCGTEKPMVLSQAVEKAMRRQGTSGSWARRSVGLTTVGSARVIVFPILLKGTRNGFSAGFFKTLFEGLHFVDPAPIRFGSLTFPEAG